MDAQKQLVVAWGRALLVLGAGTVSVYAVLQYLHARQARRQPSLAIAAPPPQQQQRRSSLAARIPTIPPTVGGGFAEPSPRRISREEPWVVSEGDRQYDLGRVRTVGFAIEELLLLEVPRLSPALPEAAMWPNVKMSLETMAAASATSVVASGAGATGVWSPSAAGSTTGFIGFTREDSVVVGDIVRSDNQRRVSRVYTRAGPRETLFFRPAEVCAAIVTCGGLCPGLNNVIRDIVGTLWHSYGVRNILGVRGGYWGFHVPEVVGAEAAAANPSCPRDGPVHLTPSSVAGIHHFGGTVLGADRGGNDPDVAVRFLKRYGVNQLYVIGGDGTHRGAQQIYRAAAAAGMAVAVAGVPKTIDNDVDIIDRSFGFDTAVAEAQSAIASAKVEAAGAPCGVTIVKLMGRFAGFIAAHATLASGDVDLCLIPEVPIVLEGPTSVTAYLERVVAAQGHAVVVVAEGAGEEILTQDKLRRGEPIEHDAGGNRKLPPILPWIQAKIAAHFSAAGKKANVRCIDPSYMIRSVPANPADSIYCALLAQSAVHGAMAGFTGFSVGLCNNRMVYLPITAITANSPRQLNHRGRTYERMLLSTGQPDPLADPAVAEEWARCQAAKGAAAPKGE